MLTVEKQQRLLREQTGSARKVYDATPIGEPWSAQQIASELLRKGSQMNYPIVVGCLSHLSEVGLVREVGRQVFIRAAVAAPRINSSEDQVKPKQANETPTGTPLERLANLSSCIKGFADNLHQLAKDIDDVALEVEEQAIHGGAEAQKFRQLQESLRTLMGVQA